MTPDDVVTAFVGFWVAVMDYAGLAPVATLE
jgi:hypothetical protein